MSRTVTRGRYQINKSVFAACFLEIIEANQQQLRLLLYSKKRGDQQVPVGTRIMLEFVGSAEDNQTFVSNTVTVLKVESEDEQFIHVCTPIQQSISQERRKQERRPVSFPVLLIDSQTLFSAVNGSINGLELRYAAQRAMMKLTVGQNYQFKFNCKGEDCLLKGVVRHIQYDWLTFEHRVGIHFPSLTKDEQIMLNLMVDPEYIVPISDKQTIDTGAGKISLND